jgi:hypothetical protein
LREEYAKMADTAEQLRRDIDSGRTRDKVRDLDPAAVPLGADEEAAGTPLSAEAVALARSQETDAPPSSNEDGGKGIYIAIIVAIGLVLVAATFLLMR